MRFLQTGYMPAFNTSNAPILTLLVTDQYRKASIVLPVGAVQPGVYTFNLIVSKGSLSASDTTQITMIWEDCPSVTIQVY